MAKLLSQHLALVEAVGVEQTMIGGSLGLLGFHRRIRAHRQPLGWRDRRNARHQGLDADGRLLRFQRRGVVWQIPAHAAHSERSGT